MKKYIIFFLIIIFIGCGSSSNKNQDNDYTKFMQYLKEYVLVNQFQEKRFDYYEISNGEILTTILNMDLVNVMEYFSLSNPTYNNSIYEINHNFNLLNKPLDINKTVDAMITYEYDSLTNVTQRAVFIKDYGLYELRKNICIINPDKDNCYSYIYVRY